MRNLFYFIVLVALFTSCTSGPEESGIYTIEQFYKNENVSGGSFSHNETSVLVSSNRSGIYNAYAWPIDGSTPSQLTHSELESCYGVTYFPNDYRILFVSDKGGNENTHLFVRTLKGRQKDLTPGANVKSKFFAWSADGESFFYLSNKRDESKFDLYEMRVDQVEKYKPESTLIYKNNAALQISCISHDKKYLALVKTKSSNNADMFIYNIAENKLTKLSKHIGEAQYKPQYFSTNNQDMYYLSNENNEYTYLAKFNVITKEKSIVYKPRWEVTSAKLSKKGNYRIVRVNENSKYAMHIFNSHSNKELELPQMQDASIVDAHISQSENLMSFIIEKSTSPGNVYVYNFKENNIKQITNTLNPEIKETNLIAGKPIKYRSFDGTNIPAIYYQPKNANEKKKVPAIVFVHGEIGGQSMLHYEGIFQYLCNNGYAILAVNNRGSSGFGKTFYRLDDQRHGKDDLKDCIESKKFLASTNVIDMDRIAIMGGSYGGYLTMAALTFAPDEFNAGINIFGVTNWVRTLQSLPAYWESKRNVLYSEMGDPYSEDSVRLREISPLFHAENVTKPLMVLQGANDVRVMQAESDEIVTAVKANGVPVEYLLFEDEGHGFRKKRNEIEAYGQVKTFLDTYLSPDKKQTES